MCIYICIHMPKFTTFLSCGRFSRLTDMVGGQNGLYPSSGLTSPPRSPRKTDAWNLKTMSSKTDVLLAGVHFDFILWMCFHSLESNI